MNVRKKRLSILIAALAVIGATAMPAQAAYTLVETRSASQGPVNYGGANRYADWSVSPGHNYLGMWAYNGDGGCTETWFDYKFTDGTHHNPYMVRRCASGSAGPIWTPDFRSSTLWGMKVITCSVPQVGDNTAISRTSSNCAGDMGWINLRSGQTYNQIKPNPWNAEQTPSGVIIYYGG